MNAKQKRKITNSLIAILGGTPVLGVAAQASEITVPRLGNVKIEQYAEEPSSWVYAQTSDVVNAAMESVRSDFINMYLKSNPNEIPQFARHTKTTGKFIEEIIDGIYGANGANWESEGYFMQVRGGSKSNNEFIFQINDKPRTVEKTPSGAAESRGTARVVTHIGQEDIEWLNGFFQRVDNYAKENGLYGPMEVATDLSGILNKLDALEKNYTDLNARLTELGCLANKIGEVENRFNTLLGENYDGTTIMTLVGLYKGIEGTVNSLKQQYDDFENTLLNELKAAIPDLTGVNERLGSLETRIDELDPTYLAGRITELEKSVKESKGTITKVDKGSKERDVVLGLLTLYFGSRAIKGREAPSTPPPPPGEDIGDDVIIGPIGRLALSYPQNHLATTETVEGAQGYLGSVDLESFLGKDLRNLGIGIYQSPNGSVDLTLGYKTRYGFFYPKDDKLNIGLSIPF